MCVASHWKRAFIILLLLMQFLPNVLTRDCLQCYQCSSWSDDPNPYCDNKYWHTHTVKKKKSYQVGCSDEAMEFCVKKITILIGGRTKTERGCVGRYDKGGHELKEGCAILSNENNDLTMCFCTKNLCNIGSLNKVKGEWFLITILSCVLIYVNAK